MARRARRIRPTVSLLGAASIALCGWLFPWAPVSVAQEVQAVHPCRVCESYTQGGETYWRCAVAEQGAKTCTPSTTSCVESGICPSATIFLQSLTGY